MVFFCSWFYHCYSELKRLSFLSSSGSEWDLLN